MAKILSFFIRINQSYPIWKFAPSNPQRQIPSICLSDTLSLNSHWAKEAFWIRRWCWPKSLTRGFFSTQTTPSPQRSRSPKGRERPRSFFRCNVSPQPRDLNIFLMFLFLFSEFHLSLILRKTLVIFLLPQYWMVSVISLSLPYSKTLWIIHCELCCQSRASKLVSQNKAFLYFDLSGCSCFKWLLVATWIS